MNFLEALVFYKISIVDWVLPFLKTMYCSLRKIMNNCQYVKEGILR